MPPSHHKHRLVALANNAQDFLDLLKEMAEDVANVNTKLDVPDTLDLRKAMHNYLINQFDLLKRYRNNALKTPGQSIDNDL
jgi:hypothetical protein